MQLVIIGSVLISTVEKKLFNSAVSLGNYIILDEGFLRVGGVTLLNAVRHEKGHQKQSKMLGWFYLLIVGVPSVIRNVYARIFKKSNEWYYSGYPEKQADKLGGVSRNGYKV